MSVAEERGDMAPTKVRLGRVMVAAFGVIIVLVGLFAWAIEDEYGAGDAPGNKIEMRPDGTMIVWDATPREHFELAATDDGHWLVLERDPESGSMAVVFEAATQDDAQYFIEQQAVVVFSGTPAEVDEWLALRDAEHENFWISGVIIASGVVLIVVPILLTVGSGRRTGDRITTSEREPARSG